jgi:hypothetical protein
VKPIVAIEQSHLITLVAATGICNLMELEKLVPANSRLAGQIRRIHESITNIAGMVGGKLDEHWINVGVEASNTGMEVIKNAILAAELNTNKKEKVDE